MLLSPPAAIGQSPMFLDVTFGKTQIEAVVTKGIMEGCGGDFFCPGEVVTREDMAVWLERGIHLSELPDYEPPACTVQDFGDVSCDYCLAPWIEQFYHDGITAGCSASPRLYCPFRPLTRGEMAVFLLKAEHGGQHTPPPCGGNTEHFDDVPCPGGFAVDWIEQLAKEGITAGCSKYPPLFCPGNPVTRDQMAVFIWKIWLR